jgi:hypothetical protein
LVSAPLGYRTDRLVEAAQDARPALGKVKPAEMVSALLHATPPNGQALGQMVDDYRRARVWETRQSLGEATAKSGPWRVRVRSRGQHG